MNTVRTLTPPTLVLAVAVAVALVSAGNQAGSWHDGSRLAIVESLVDHGTFAIDDSIFVRVPDYPDGNGPYPATEPALRQAGTLDKLRIDGRFYSDKPVPAVLMAGLYEVWRSCGGPTARERPDLFCRLMALSSAGLAYVLAVCCIYALGRTVGLSLGLRLALAASFGLATVALPYARQVSVHIMLLGVGSATFLGITLLAEAQAAGRTPWLLLAGLGTLAGFGYTLDLGTGPVLLAGLFALVAWRCRRVGALGVFVGGALPWLAAHHALSYAIGGTILKPINAVPEYSAWPGCPFTPDSLTGSWKHGVVHLFVYLLALLAGKRGFLGHNLPLFLAVLGAAWLLRQRVRERAEIALAVGWSVGTWLLYGAMSNNYSGACCSVRWFVPLLAPAYYVLALVLRQWPTLRWDFAVLSAWGAVLAAIMWRHGPWMRTAVPFFWPIQALALGSWLACRHWRQRVEPARAKGSLNIARMRQIDRWLGVPVCFALSGVRRLLDRRHSDLPVRRILFLKLAEQGSTVLAHGALRRAVEKVGRDNVFFLLFAENRPILDLMDIIPPGNVLAINARGLLSAVWGAVTAILRMRRLCLDAAIDLEFFARSSAALCYLSGAPVRAGYHAFGGEASYRGDLMTHRVSFNPYLHTSQTFQILVEALDQPAAAFPKFDLDPPAIVPAPPFQPEAAELDALRQTLGSLLGHAGGRLILLNANASDLLPLRRWPSERYVELAQRLLARYADAHIVFTGAPSEAPAAEALAARVGSARCVSMAGRTTLRQLLVVCCLAEVLVTNDSGPAHFASLTPIDVVVLFGPETPRLFAAPSPRTHPLWAGLACSPCINAFNDRNSACTDNVCMQRLTVAHVLDQVAAVYEQRTRTARPLTEAA